MRIWGKAVRHHTPALWPRNGERIPARQEARRLLPFLAIEVVWKAKAEQRPAERLQSRPDHLDAFSGVTREFDRWLWPRQPVFPEETTVVPDLPTEPSSDAPHSRAGDESGLNGSNLSRSAVPRKTFRCPETR